MQNSDEPGIHLCDGGNHVAIDETVQKENRKEDQVEEDKEEELDARLGQKLTQKNFSHP